MRDRFILPSRVALVFDTPLVARFRLPPLAWNDNPKRTECLALPRYLRGWRRMGPGRSAARLACPWRSASTSGWLGDRTRSKLLRGLGAAEADEGVAGLRRELGGAAA